MEAACEAPAAAADGGCECGAGGCALAFSGDSPTACVPAEGGPGDRIASICGVGVPAAEPGAGVPGSALARLAGFGCAPLDVTAAAASPSAAASASAEVEAPTEAPSFFLPRLADVARFPLVAVFFAEAAAAAAEAAAAGSGSADATPPATGTVAPDNTSDAAEAVSCARRSRSRFSHWLEVTATHASCSELCIAATRRRRSASRKSSDRSYTLRARRPTPRVNGSEKSSCDPGQRQHPAAHAMHARASAPRRPAPPPTHAFSARSASTASSAWCRASASSALEAPVCDSHNIQHDSEPPRRVSVAKPRIAPGTRLHGAASGGSRATELPGWPAPSDARQARGPTARRGSRREQTLARGRSRSLAARGSSRDTGAPGAGSAMGRTSAALRALGYPRGSSSAGGAALLLSISALAEPELACNSNWQLEQAVQHCPASGRADCRFVATKALPAAGRSPHELAHRALACGRRPCRPTGERLQRLLPDAAPERNATHCGCARLLRTPPEHTAAPEH